MPGAPSVHRTATAASRGAPSSWRELLAPVPAAPLDPGASLNETVCPRAADCLSVGQYFSSTGIGGLLATDVGAVWRSTAAPVPAGVRPADFVLDAVACPSTGTSLVACVAGGVASQAPGGDGEAVLDTRSASGWVATTAPGVAAGGGMPSASDNSYSAIDGISCPQVGSCVAIASTNEGTRAVIVEQTHGRWTDLTVPLPPGAASGGRRELQLSQVVCSAPGACAAVGSYITSSGLQHAMIVSETGGTWTWLGAPVPPNVDGSGLNGISCPGEGACVAVGWYETSGGILTPTVLTETPSGFVSSPVHLPPALAGDVAGMEAIDCPAAGRCVAAGQATSNAGIARTFLWTSSGTSAPTVQLVPLPADFAGGSMTVDAISCAAVGQCGLAGGLAGRRTSATVVVIDDAGRLRVVSSAPSPAPDMTTGASPALGGGSSPAQGGGASPAQGGGSSPGVRLGGRHDPLDGGVVPRGPAPAPVRDESWLDRLAAADRPAGPQGPMSPHLAGAASPVTSLTSTALQLGGLLDTIACRSARAKPLTCNAGGATFDSHGDLLPVSVVVSGTTGRQSSPPVPGGGIKDELASLDAVACPAPDECVVVGSAVNSSDEFVDGSLVDEATGPQLDHLASSILPLPPGALAHQAENLSDVACVSADYCMASGIYDDRSGNQEGLLAVDDAGRWAVSEAPLPAHTPAASDPTLDAVGCSPRGGCLVVGEDGPYQADGGGVGLLWTDWNGRITVRSAPLPAGSSTPELENLWTVSCYGKANCVVGGSYHDSSFAELPLLIRVRGSTSSVIGLALPISVVGDDVTVTDVSCGPGIPCAAALWNELPDGTLSADFARPARSRWPTVLAGLPIQGIAGDSIVDELSCSAACSAVGYVRTLTGRSVATLWAPQVRGHGWSAVAAPVPAYLSRLPVSSTLSSVSCAAPGDECVAVGTAGSSELVDVLVDGRWRSEVTPGLPGVSDVELNEVRCSADLAGGADACLAVGYATTPSARLETVLEVHA
ncbi:MAG: hypothetical protein ABSE47_04170 [Acidimicrobiales bacterium]